MRVEGDRPAAVLRFSAWQQQVRELAWIVDAAVLEAELAAALRYAPHVQQVAEPVPAATRLPTTMSCTQVPTSETTAAPHSNRTSRWRSGTKGWLLTTNKRTGCTRNYRWQFRHTRRRVQEREDSVRTRISCSAEHLRLQRANVLRHGG